MQSFFSVNSNQLFLKFLQAVLDDDFKQVRKTLNITTEYLCYLPQTNLTVLSLKTKQRFAAENPLKLALKRSQIDMIKLLLTYFEKHDAGLAQAIKQWDEVAQDVPLKDNKEFQAIRELLELKLFKNRGIRYGKQTE